MSAPAAKGRPPSGKARQQQQQQLPKQQQQQKKRPQGHQNRPQQQQHQQQQQQRSSPATTNTNATHNPNSSNTGGNVPSKSNSGKGNRNSNSRAAVVEKHKVVVRNLPPNLSREAFESALHAKGVSEHQYNYLSYLQGKCKTYRTIHSVAFLSFPLQENLSAFYAAFHENVFVNERGHPFKAHVEYAPMQKIPKGRVRKDKYNGTIEKDKDYIAFLKTLEEEKNRSTLTAEMKLEQKEKDEAAAGDGSKVIVTPLMQFILDKRANKHKQSKGKGSRSEGTKGGAKASSKSKGQQSKQGDAGKSKSQGGSAGGTTNSSKSTKTKDVDSKSKKGNDKQSKQTSRSNSTSNSNTTGTAGEKSAKGPVLLARPAATKDDTDTLASHANTSKRPQSAKVSKSQRSAPKAANDAKAVDDTSAKASSRPSAAKSGRAERQVYVPGRGIGRSRGGSNSKGNSNNTSGSEPSSKNGPSDAGNKQQRPVVLMKPPSKEASLAGATDSVENKNSNSVRPQSGRGRGRGRGRARGGGNSGTEQQQKQVPT